MKVKRITSQELEDYLDHLVHWHWYVHRYAESCFSPGEVAHVPFVSVSDTKVTSKGTRVAPTKWPGHGSPAQNPDFILKVSPLGLAVAVARSGVCSWQNGGDGLLLFFHAQQAVSRVLACTDFSNNQELRARPGLHSLRRDSDRTSIASEFGQALSWLVAMKEWKASALVDFETVESALPFPSLRSGRSKKKPDFAAFRGASMFLLECKGALRKGHDKAPWKEALKKADAQLKSGRSHLARFVHPNEEAATSFVLSETKRSRGVFFCRKPPPPAQSRGTQPSEQRILAKHYWYWALSAGDIELAEVLAKVADGQDIAEVGLERKLNDRAREFEGQKIVLPGWPLHRPESRKEWRHIRDLFPPLFFGVYPIQLVMYGAISRILRDARDETVEPPPFFNESLSPRFHIESFCDGTFALAPRFPTSD